MARYASSKLRLILLVILLAAGILATTGYAQTSGADTTTTTVPANNVFTLIFSHWLDPVFWVIGILSVAALTLIIQGFITNREAVLLPEASTNQMREMIEQRRLKDLLEFTETDPSFVAGAINAALKRASGGFAAMKEAMETAVGEQTAEQFRKIEWLNIIGNLGPLLGLLGTVLGMIEAFEEMYAHGGTAKPADLAHGISTALTHTLLGLALAIPCLAAFGYLRTVVDRLTVKGAMTSEEMLLMLKPPEVRPAASVARPMPAGPQVAAPPRRPPTMPSPSPLVSG